VLRKSLRQLKKREEMAWNTDLDSVSASRSKSKEINPCIGCFCGMIWLAILCIFAWLLCAFVCYTIARISNSLHLAQ
jgi:hypothetical protein